MLHRLRLRAFFDTARTPGRLARGATSRLNRDLGTLDQDAVLSGRYVIGNVESLRAEEREALLTLAAQRLISRNVCCREHLGSSTLLIFPGLIKQKRPLIDPVETTDDISYVVQGTSSLRIPRAIVAVRAAVGCR